MINNNMNTLFKSNKYTTCYFNIIHSVLQQKRVILKRGKTNFVYYERHHIIPKSMGGSNESSNLISLTAREHYICHLLLTKMCLSQQHTFKMVYALNYTLNTSAYRPGTSYIYESIRLKIADQVSEFMQVYQKNRPPQTAETRKKRSEAMKGKKFSPEHKAKLKEAKIGRIITDEWKANLSTAAIGRKVSTATKQKLSKALKGSGRPWSVNNGKAGAAKQSIAVTGRRRLYKEDGSWVWQYPTQDYNINVVGGST